MVFNTVVQKLCDASVAQHVCVVRTPRRTGPASLRHCSELHPGLRVEFKRDVTGNRFSFTECIGGGFSVFVADTAA